ncbi:MAG: hypothetical protein LBR56_00665 [Sporomusaceae bacterium]|nr:hypothetical protein [Sporomusaceae bacterium]
MKFKFKKITFVFLVFILTNMFVVTAENSKPDEVITKYLQALEFGEIDTAYAMLTDNLKQKTAREDFATAFNLRNKVSLLQETTIFSSTSLIDKKLDNVMYSQAIEYSVHFVYFDYVTNKTAKTSKKIYIVKENNKWSVHSSASENINLYLSKLYTAQGYILLENNDAKDNIPDAILSLRKAIEYSHVNIDAHFFLSRAYTECELYDESIAEGLIAINLIQDDNISKARLLYNIGYSFSKKNDMEKAAYYWRESLKADPGNEHSKFALQSLEVK